MAVSERPLIVDIDKHYASGVAVAVSLDVVLGGDSTLVLFGPSGAGKTTVLRALAGLERPERGRIVFGAATWFDAAGPVWVDPQRRRVGCVFQDPALFPHLTALQNIAFALRGDRPARDRRARQLAASLGIEEVLPRRASQLSGGEAQRVALARALAPHPQLLLLDEPFASVDAPTRARLRREVGDFLARAGVPAILVTHDRTDAIALGSNVAVMTGGRVRQVGPVDEVFSRPADLDVAESVGVESVLAATVEQTEAGILTLRIGETRLRAAAVGQEAGSRDVFACIRAEDVTLERAPSAGASARNHLPARVVSIAHEGAVDRVTLDCGFPLVALITRQASEEMGLRPGAPIVGAIKATSVHVVPRPGR